MPAPPQVPPYAPPSAASYIPPYAAGIQGPGAVPQALVTGLQAYHTPYFADPTPEQLAALDEEYRKTMELRQKATEAYATGMNTAVASYWKARTDAAQQLVGMLDAIAKNNMASAEARKAAADLASQYVPIREGRSNAQIYNAPVNPDATKGIDQASASGAANLLAQWAASRNGGNGASPLDAARTLALQHAHNMANAERQALGASGTGPGNAPDEGTWHYGSAAMDLSLDQWLSQSGLSAEDQAKVRVEALNTYMADAGAGLPPDTLQTWQARGMQAVTDRRNTDALEAELKRGFGLPPEDLNRLRQSFETAVDILDPTRPNHYASMARSAGDPAVSPLASQILSLDQTLADIERRRLPQDDPFLSQVREFASNHPWFGDWASAQGIRHPEEAMRWITNHPELVGQMDTAWRQWGARPDAEDFDPGRDPALATTDPTVQTFRAYLRDRDQRSNRIARENHDPSNRLNLQTSGLERAVAEIGGLFGRPSKPLELTPIPPGAPGSASYRQPGTPMPGQFGNAPLRAGESPEVLPGDRTPAPVVTPTTPLGTAPTAGTPTGPGGSAAPAPAAPSDPRQGAATPAVDLQQRLAQLHRRLRVPANPWEGGSLG